MPAHPLSDQVLQATADAYAEHGTIYGAAKALGVNRMTFSHRLTQARERFAATSVRAAVVTPAPEDDLTVGELLTLRKTVFERKAARDRWSRLIPVAIHDDKPIAITVFGDPHVDDDNCDIGALEADLDTVTNTDGMYALHLGDITNNWIGRLARKYADQMTTRSQGFKLAEWIFAGRPNLAVVFGNHDSWQDCALLEYMNRNSGAVAVSHGVRLGLTFPNGHEIRVHARHDFPGRSMYSSTHGMKRETLFGHRDHLLLAGHIHVDEARIEPIDAEGIVSHFYRVSGYKVIDDYAQENRFIEKRMAPALTLVLRPGHKVQAEWLKPFWSVQEAGEYITYLRSKR